jgi:Arginase family
MRENTLNQFLSFALGCLLFLSAMLVAPGNAGAQTAPTFVGVRTFLSAPYEPDLDKLKADFAVLGVPFDEGTWGQPGERYGPRDMRENSQEYAHDLENGRCPCYAGW